MPYKDFSYRNNDRTRLQQRACRSVRSRVTRDDSCPVTTPTRFSAVFVHRLPALSLSRATKVRHVVTCDFHPSKFPQMSFPQKEETLPLVPAAVVPRGAPVVPSVVMTPPVPLKARTEPWSPAGLGFLVGLPSMRIRVYGWFAHDWTSQLVAAALLRKSIDLLCTHHSMGSLRKEGRKNDSRYQPLSLPDGKTIVEEGRISYNTLIANPN